MNKNKELNQILAPCGIYCPECSFRVAYETQNRAHLTPMPAKFDKFKGMELEQFNCAGCISENKFADCKMKQCVTARKLQHCGQCDEFPCELINNFANDGLPHHKKAKENLEYVRKHGLDKFFEEIEKRIHCACGEKLSWYVTKCPACGENAAGDR